MTDTPIKILLIEDKPGGAQKIRQILEKAETASFNLHVDHLSSDLGCLTAEETDIVLLDISHTNSKGLDTFLKASSQKPYIPFIVLNDDEDKALSKEAMEMGAQDYLVKKRMDSIFLTNSVEFAIQRNQLIKEFWTTEFQSQQIIMQNVDGIVIVDRSGIIRFVNPTAEILFNKKAEELLGKPYGFPIVTGESKEFEVKHKNDVIFDLEMHPIEIIWKGEAAYLALVRDITEKKNSEKKLQESEERFRSLFEQSNDPIIIHDMDGKILDVNSRTCEILGYNKKELQSMMIHVLHPKNELPAMDELFKTLQHKGHERFETKLKTSEGSNIDVEISSRVTYKEKGIVQAIIRDISERKKIEEERIQNNKVKSLGFLAGGLAHDFNNLLTIILGNISSVQTFVPPDNEVYRILEKANEAGMCARDLIDQFLTFSKEKDTFKQRGSLLELIKETTKSVLGSSNIMCEFSLQDDLWQVEFDAMMLRKVFTNLINNAHEAMPNGGIIKIWVENIISGQEEKRQVSTIKHGRYIKITIQDNGLGIPAEHLPLIFDPYFSTKKRSMQKGMGLGLTTVFSIIKKHDGYIHIESEEKVGTTVYLYLPVSESKN